MRRPPHIVLADAAKRIEAAGGRSSPSETGTSLRFSGHEPRSSFNLVSDGHVSAVPVDGDVLVSVDAGVGGILAIGLVVGVFCGAADQLAFAVFAAATWILMLMTFVF